jgi:glycosyltransferase involved in cell wall biosynthesis
LTAPIRVLHCRSSSGRHGPERALLEQAPALAARQVETRLLVLYRRPAPGPERHPWVDEARAQGIDAEQIPDPGALSVIAARRLARRVRSSGAEILHTHDYKTNMLGGLAARRVDRSMAWVATVHLHTTTSRRLRLYRALDLFLLRLADRVITVSREQRRLLLRRGVDRRRIALIPNVIDAAAFAARAEDPLATRDRLGLAAAAPVVTLVGRLTAQKGVDSFLDAAHFVRERQPEAAFLVVGNGPGRSRLETQADALGLDGAVHFLGYRDEVAPILAASDVVVVPSRAEGLPLVLLEALAVGRPVVASQVGGIPDLLHHGETGLLVPPDDPLAVADNVLRLLADRGWAEGLGEAGRHQVLRVCAPERAARRLAAVYRTVLAERT